MLTPSCPRDQPAVAAAFCTDGIGAEKVLGDAVEVKRTTLFSSNID